MPSEALPIDWIFQPSRRLADWLRHWAARQLERRQAPRRRVARLAAHYWDGSAANTHVVRDVSTGGAFICADFKWPLGTILALSLQLEGQSAALLLQTKVVRCTSDGLGVQFLCFSKPERQNVANFLRGIAGSRLS
jgi:hypothetical protein